jgi:hypothetical protein
MKKEELESLYNFFTKGIQSSGKLSQTEVIQLCTRGQMLAQEYVYRLEEMAEMRQTLKVSPQDVIPGKLYLVKDKTTGVWHTGKYFDPSFGWVNTSGNYICGDGAGGVSEPAFILDIEALEKKL